MENEFITACSALGSGNASAEKTLLELRKSPLAISTAQNLLSSTNVTDSMVLFQASLMLRNASIEQWSAMTEQGKAILQQQVFELLLSQAERLPKPVWMQLIYTSAILLKRGWLELKEQRTNLFTKVSTLLQANDQPFSLPVLLGLNLLCTLVDEFQFSSSRASAIGMSFAFHRQCHESFEKAGLREAFAFGSLFATRIAQMPSLSQAISPMAVEVIRSCLTLLERCLSWSFRCGGGSETNARVFEAESFIVQSSDHLSLSVESRIRPGVGWRDALLGSPLFIQVVHKLYMETRSWAMHERTHGADQIPHLLRQLIVLLSGLSGDIFVNDEQKIAYLECVMNISLRGIIASPIAPISVAAGVAQTFESAGGSCAEAVCANAGAEYLDMCQLLGSVVSNFSAASFVRQQSFKQSLEMLVELSKGLLEGAAVCAASAVQLQDNDIDNSWIMEAFGHVLDFWVSLSDWALQDNGNEPVEVEAKEALQQVSAYLFKCYVEQRLAIARVSITREAQTEDDEYANEDPFSDPSVLQDHLSAVAYVARVNAAANVMFLVQVFQGHHARLEEAMNQPMSQVVVDECNKLSEELFWVVLLSAHCLANPIEGERPMIPTPMLRLSKSFCDARQLNTTNITLEASREDPVVQLSWCLLRFLEFESDRVQSCNGSDERISPLLAETLLEAVTRWCSSYLLPELGAYAVKRSTRIQQCLPVTIQVSFGPNEQGRQIMDFLLKAASIYLSVWGTETAVNEKALGLLKAIVDNPASKKLLLQLHSWEQLCQAFVASAQHRDWVPLNGLSRQAHGHLFELLLRSLEVSLIAPSKQIEVSANSFEQLFAPVSARLASITALLGNGDTNASLSQPLWCQDFDRLLYIYMGTCKAADCGPLASWSRDRVIESFTSNWAPMATAAVIYLQKSGLSSASSAVSTAKHVVRSVLLLVSTFINDQLLVSGEDKLLRVWETSDKVVQIYKEYYNLLSAANAKTAEVEAEDWAQDMLQLLQMLTTIVERDAVDLSEEDPVNANDKNTGLSASRVVLQGVSLIFPLITKELLQFPMVAEQFFHLMTALVHSYPQELSMLQQHLFRPIVTALEFGMSDHREIVARRSFEALTALAEYHSRAVNGHPPSPGLGQNLYVVGTNGESMFLHLLQKVLQFVVFENCPYSLLNTVANTLFILITCEQSNYTAMVEQMINSQQDPEIQARLSHAFTALTSANDMKLNYNSRRERTIFQQNLLAFVNEVRGFMRTR